MTAARDELRRLVEQLPEEQLSTALAKLQRLAEEQPKGTWPPEFFGIIDGSHAPTNAVANVDLYLAAYGFGRDSP